MRKKATLTLLSLALVLLGSNALALRPIQLQGEKTTLSGREVPFYLYFETFVSNVGVMWDESEEHFTGFVWSHGLDPQSDFSLSLPSESQHYKEQLKLFQPLGEESEDLERFERLKVELLAPIYGRLLAEIRRTSRASGENDAHAVANFRKRLVESIAISVTFVDEEPHYGLFSSCQSDFDERAQTELSRVTD